MFSLEYPIAILLIGLFLICFKYCKARSESLIFPHINLFLQKSKPPNLIKILKYATIIFAILALSSPIIEDRIIQEKNDGYAISLILDASRSMAPPMMTDKFAITKKIVNEFIAKRINDQIGLIVFADFAYVASPLTYDKNILKEILKNTDVGVAGERFTAIYDSLFQSAKLLSKTNAKTKIAILLTDGQNNITNIPYNASVSILKKYGVKVYTIGIGSDREFDKAELIKIAKSTNGEFFQADSTKTLKKIYAKIDKMEKSEIKSQKFSKKSYLYEYFLLLAILFLTTYLYIINIVNFRKL